MFGKINGNQLSSVVDQSTSDLKTEGFVTDGVNNTANYTYDSNGNMITDDLKGITDIEYNHLNLPRKITFDNLDPEAISSSKKGFIYIYSAIGIKLEKKMFDLPSQVKTTQYAGNYIYEDSELKFFNHPEGYIVPVLDTEGSVKGYSGGTTTYSSYSYVFQFKDHLGNVRLSYSDNDLDGAINPLDDEIIEESNYYPFGLKQRGYNYDFVGANNKAQQWKFNDIELNEDIGLNLYEMFFRMHDPAIGRWNGVDPITHWNESPYAGFANNPVYWADPSGADTVFDNFINEILDNSAPDSETSWNNNGTGFFVNQSTGYFVSYSGLGSNSIPTALPGITITTGSNGGDNFNNFLGNVADLEDQIYDTHWYNRYYGQSGDGGYWNSILKNIDDLNQFNPIAIGWDLITYGFTGNDRFGNSMSKGKAYGYSLSMVPIGRVSILGQGLKVVKQSPKYLYHYTSKEAAQSISKNGLKVGKDGFSYLTNTSALKPLQAQIELALPTNRALPNSILRINTSGLSTVRIGRIQGNLSGLGAGGGTEFLFNKTIPAATIKIIK